MNHAIDGTNLVPRRSAKQKFRQQVFEAWNSKCVYCGAPADTLDHVKPRHKGGNTVACNLAPACCKCNRSKGSEEWNEWFKRQQSWSELRLTRIQSWIE